MKKRSILNYLSIFSVTIFIIGTIGTVSADAFDGNHQEETPQITPTIEVLTDEDEAEQEKIPLYQNTSYEFTLAETAFYADDVTVQGALASETFGFRLPQTWAMNSGSSVTIEFSHPTNLADYSTMAVDFNGVRIGSVVFTPENADHGSITLNIPVNIFRESYNDLNLQFYMGISDNYCDDLENPGVWATIHNSTSFNFAFREIAPTPDLGLFPYPILQASDLIVNQITMIIPDKPNEAELNAVAILSSKLGQLNSFYTMNIDVISESMTIDPTNMAGNLIYIGLAENLKILSSENLPFVNRKVDEIEFKYLGGVSIDNEDGVIWEDSSPIDKRYVRLIVSGLTESALVKAARGLANDSVYVRLQGQFGVIQNVPAPIGAEEFKQTFTFEELGYTDRTSTGTYQQTINYNIPLAVEWRVATQATLNLHFAHSALLNPQGSTLSVLVNTIPVGSSVLDAENAENGYVSIQIPSRLLEIGFNTLSIVTKNQLPYDPQIEYFCDDEHTNDAWVSIFSDSSLTLPEGPATRVVDLRYFPFGFTGADDLSELTFVVSGYPENVTAQAIAWIASTLGRDSQSADLSPNLVFSSAANISKSNQNQILIGQPQLNPTIYEMNDILPLPFVEGENNLQDPEEVGQIMAPSGSGSTGYIQGALTADGTSRLVVAGNSDDGVLWAAKALNDQVSLDELKGNYAILNAPGAIYSAQLPEEVIAPIETNLVQEVVDNTIESITGTSNSWVLWLSGGLFLLTILIIIIFVLISFRKKDS